MRINRKVDMATDAISHIVSTPDSKPVALSAIASQQEMSLAYFEQVFSMLLKAGLVESVRGPGGGYRAPNLEATYFDIVKAITGERILHEGKARAMISSQTYEVWKRITLADLIV